MNKLANWLIILCPLSGCISSNKPTFPVSISASGIDDACGGIGIVVANTADKVAIFSHPENDSRELVQLKIGSKVLLCDEENGWYGVIIPRKGVQCISDEENSDRQPINYSGPCESGWIEKLYVEFLAG